MALKSNKLHCQLFHIILTMGTIQVSHTLQEIGFYNCSEIILQDSQRNF